jgi:hypothetical protein
MAARKERDRIERRQWEQQYAAEEQAKEDKRLAPIRKAEAVLIKTHGQLLKAEREAALNGKEDPAFVRSLLSEPMKTVRLDTIEQADEFNRLEALKFVERTPDYHQSPYNASLLADWCRRNDLMVCDAATWAAIFRHLDGLGLMEHEAPQPEPETVIEQESVPVQQAEFAGVDPISGQSRIYTRYEVESMSSETYRRSFRIPSKWQHEYEEQQAMQAGYESQRAGQ